MSRALPPLSLSLQFGDFDDAEQKQRHRAVLTRHRVQRSLRHALEQDVEQAEITVRIVDSAEGQALNQSYRQKDYATNVLTFPLTEEPWLIGDIILCAPVVEKEAKEQGISLEAHYAHLTIHGILHMHGYDHEEEAQAELMESIESATMMQLGYADPYLSEKQKS